MSIENMTDNVDKERKKAKMSFHSYSTDSVGALVNVIRELYEKLAAADEFENVIQECLTEEEVELLRAEGYIYDDEILPTYEFKDSCIGDTVKFGRYPQVNGEEATSIEWVVLRKEQNKALLVSKKILDAMPFDEDGYYLPEEFPANYEAVYSSVSHDPGYPEWAKCGLRGWLNGLFMENAFSVREKSLIIPMYMEDAKTVDAVFLLNENEARTAVRTCNEIGCEATALAVENGLDMDTEDNGRNNSPVWWLRSGNIKNGKCWLIQSAKQEVYFTGAECGDHGVLPAMWVRC